MIKIIIWSLLMVINWRTGLCQSENHFSSYRLEHWNTKNGLPNDLVLSIHQSKEGFIWLTSYSSLTRFDGVNFTAFNSRTVPLMKTDVVESLLTETEDSTLWIPTPNSGLLAYKNGKFTPYLQNYFSLRLVAASAYYEMLFITNAEKTPYILFDARTKKVRRLTEELIRELLKTGKFLTPNGIDKAGNLWRRFNNKIIRIQQGKLYVIGAKEGILNASFSNGVYVDKQDRVWMTTEKGLYFWTGNKMLPYPGMEDKTFVKNAISSRLLIEDRKGIIWAATGSGLACLLPNTSKFVFVAENHPLRDVNFTNLMEDNEGDIWLSSQTGIYKLSDSKFKNFSKENGFNDNRTSGVCVLDTNKYLAGSLGKLYSIENGIVRPYIFKNKSVADQLREIYFIYKDTRGDVWVCTDLKVIKITSNGETIPISVDGTVRFAFEDVTGKMWFGVAFGGIAFLNEKKELEYLNFPQVDFKSLFISSIRILRNGNWLVTSFNKGAILIDAASGKPTYLNTAGVPNIGMFNSIEDADGTIWMPTQAGLSRYKDGKLSDIGFKDGLPENSLFGFLPDQEGYVWFPSNRGLIRAKKQELADYLDKKLKTIQWRLYDEGDGMLNRQCIGARHGKVSPDGKILVPTFGGILEIDPGRLIPNPLPPPVVIHTVSRDDKKIDPAQDNIFEPGNHRYIFGYSGLSLVAPEKVQMKFRLIGYDNDWINSVGDRKAFYTNIPSGKYTFQVIACNNDGVWNLKGASFSFTVRPFFYETVWFNLLIAIALLLFIWLTIKWRTKAVHKKNELLEAQVAARTKDLNKVNIELNQSNEAIATQRDSLEKTLTELKSAQTQLIQSEKMASLGELTAGIAHEIQNPLNFVNNFSEVNKEMLEELKAERLKPATERDDVLQDELINDVIDNEEKINHHGKRADSIVKGMLQHSRAGSGQKEPTNINALADEYLRLSYQGFRAKDKNFNASINTSFDPAIGLVNMVPQDIGRVLLNLYNNAFYAASLPPERGANNNPLSVWISTKRISLPSGAGGLEISVRDNGPGIPSNIIDKIFQPFFTTKPTGQGTGLGLSLSYDIVKAHGGEIRVDSKETEGSEFIIQLPV